MSDLIGGPTSSARGQNGSTRPVQGAGPGQSQHPGVRTPTDIMRGRREREQKRREMEEQERREAERRRREAEQAADVAVGTGSGLPGPNDPRRRDQAPPGDSAVPTQRVPPPEMQSAQNVPANPQYQARPIAAGSQATGAASTGAVASQRQPQPQQRTTRTNSNLPQTTQPTGQQTQATTSQPTQDQPRKSTFPHAFERWETLSSHWEGLTGYWIRKLEENKDELSANPLNQQMARQINDLSAAGANLFHAVVELQRLRASSERKFQRWFFDTRAEQEKAREVQADLERQLISLRQEQADAASLRQKAENERRKSEELVKEMRRELQISKEEARRAWEELGRREQEERERTNSLRNGEPTLVGGVQVVPMVQGVPSRQTSVNRPPTREGPYPGGPGPTSLGGQPPQGAAQPSRSEEYYEDPRLSPGEADPFVDSRRAHRSEVEPQTYRASSERQPPISNGMVPSSHAVASQGYPASSTAAYGREQTGGHFYQHEGSAIHPETRTSEADDRSYVPSTEGSDLGEEEYMINPDGSYRLDAHGRRIPYPRTTSEESEEYAERVARPGGYQGTYTTGVEMGNLTASSGGSAPGYGPGLVDYSGSDWGSGPGWEAVPRHRHPTRLSDVLEEEDERSRTSPSRASQASRTMH